MLNKISALAYLATASAIASMTVNCSSDDTAAPGPTTTTVGSGGQSGAGAGGSTGGGGGATGGSTGGTSAGTGGTAGGDAAADSGGAQAQTAVILIDNVVVARKAADAGGSEAGASDAAVVAVDGASDASGPIGVTYAFDSDIQGWHYTPFGSSPNIGMADPGDAGRLKLSDTAVSQLAFDSTNDADLRVDASGALKLTVGFVAANDQIDAQAFSLQPNDATQWKVWSGFVATARVRLVSGGNVSATCPLRATIYITTGSGYATAISPPVNLTRSTDWATVTFDFDTIAPGANAPNLAQVNQLGVQITTGTCP